MNKHNELHLFIDESGRLAGDTSEDDVLLVGGMLWFGAYDRRVDDALLAILKRNVGEVGGSFPSDLHFGNNALAHGKLKPFLSNTSSELKAWSKEENQSAYGVSIMHAHDFFDQGPALLREQRFDNRYVNMLWSLVEHILLVDKRTANRLNPGARVHLHLAQRAYVFEKSNVSADELGKLGYDVIEDRKDPSRFVVRSSLDEAEVRGMLRVALRRWASPPFTIAEIDVCRLKYQGGTSKAGLYLADLYLGQIRQRELGRKRGYRPNLKQLLDELSFVKYGRQIEVLAMRQRAIDEKDLRTFFLFANESLENDVVAKAQERAVAVMATEAPDELARILQEACDLIDTPGRSESGIALVRAARSILGHCDPMVLLEVLAQKAELSYANHRGNAADAQQVWEHYEQLEPELPLLETTGMKLMFDMRIRRAVQLMDRFEFERALDVLAELGDVQAGLMELIAKRFQLPTDKVPQPQLGACYSALGQAHALRQEDDDASLAEWCFDQSLDRMAAEADLARELIYLGHLACDAPQERRSLWERVCGRMPQLDELWTRNDGQQYLLALQLKGLLMFGSDQDLLAGLDAWSKQRPLQGYSSESKALHPFGLIHQCLALCHQRAWRLTQSDENLRAAEEQFQQAEAHMAAGGTLLQVLSLAAKMRRLLLKEESGSNRASRDLEKACDAFVDIVAAAYGERAWSEAPDGSRQGRFGAVDRDGLAPHERANALLGLIRFNYW